MPEENFEDEPMTGGRKHFTGERMVIENMDDVERRRRKRRRKRKKRLERLGKLAVCVCCAGVLAAVVLTIVLTEAAIAVTTPAPPTPVPTMQPTTHKPTVAHPTPTVPHHVPSAPAPTVPTTPAPVPTTPVVLKDTYVLTPNQDTYIYLNGNKMTKSYGNEETLLVQKGVATNAAVGDSIAIMTFDTSSIPSFDQFTSDSPQAILRMYHEPLDITEVREAAPMTVSRMNSTSLLIESLNGNTYTQPHYWDGPTMDVPTDSVVIEFDVTDLVFGTPFQDDQLFLMIQTRNQEQEVGDLFYSRESDSPPALNLLNLLA